LGPTEQNPRFATTFGVLERDPLLRGKIKAPELFRYDGPESLASSLREGGFSKVSTAYHTVPFPSEGPVEEAWECFSELSACSCGRSLRFRSRIKTGSPVRYWTRSENITMGAP
jgi:hypothetical protein